MAEFTVGLLASPASARLVDDLAAEKTPVPLPGWAVMEAVRRRDEMLADPNLGSTDEEVWKRINDSRNG